MQTNQKQERGTKTELPNTHPLLTKDYIRQPKLNIILQEKQWSKLPEFEFYIQYTFALILFATEADFRKSNVPHPSAY